MRPPCPTALLARANAAKAAFPPLRNRSPSATQACLHRRATNASHSASSAASVACSASNPMQAHHLPLRLPIFLFVLFSAGRQEGSAQSSNTSNTAYSMCRCIMVVVVAMLLGLATGMVHEYAGERLPPNELSWLLLGMYDGSTMDINCEYFPFPPLSSSSSSSLPFPFLSTNKQTQPTTPHSDHWEIGYIGEGTRGNVVVTRG